MPIADPQNGTGAVSAPPGPSGTPELANNHGPHSEAGGA
jgi:hypothetical protein